MNFHASVSGYTGVLNLQGGTVNVGGPMNVGYARMETSPTDTNAVVNQAGGTLTVNGAMSVGLSGVAQSIYNASGGALTANNGLTVNTLGNAVFNVSGSANVSVPGSIDSPALVIGGDILGTTGGTVNQSGGTLAVGGDLVLGNAGVGAMLRSGGVFSGGGNLVAAGAGTLILNGSAASAATYFAGQLQQSGDGTLIVIPDNNLLTGNESLSFGVSSSLSSHSQGIVGPWVVREASATDSTGDYVTLSPTSGTYSLGTASYTGTNLTSSSGTDVISVAGSGSLSTSTSAYAVKFGDGSITALAAR